MDDTLVRWLLSKVTGREVSGFSSLKDCDTFLRELYFRSDYYMLLSAVGNKVNNSAVL